MTLTAEQLEIRRGGLTATDMTKLTGMSRYGGPIDVLLDKRGVAEPFVDTDRVKWGNILETPIRDDYAHRQQVAVDVPGTLRHPGTAWALATPDGIVSRCGIAVGATIDLDGNPPIRGWECKTHTSYLAHLYGEPGTDEVPPWELVQCAWNLYVARAYYDTPLDRWDLTVFMDGVPADYVIHRDPELEAMLVEVAEAFWSDHVVGGKELDPDGSESYSKELARRFPDHDKLLAPCDDITRLAVEDLREARAHRRHLEAHETKLVQQIKAAIGDHAGIVWEDEDGKAQRITWKRTKDAERTDWKAVAQALRNQIELMASDLPAGQQAELMATFTAITDQYTTIKPGSRRFVVPRSWNQ